MCGTCKECGPKGGCSMYLITKILVIIGGLNWGLVGVSMVLGKGDAYNLVKLLVGSMPTVEAIIYILVGLAALSMIFHCKCKKCVVSDESTPNIPSTPVEPSATL